MRHGRIAAAAMVLLCAQAAMAQASPPAAQRLTLQEAIRQGLRANLSVLLSKARVDEAAGTRLRRLSAALLPQVHAQAYANFQNRNLRAFGISLPGMPEVVGPFSNYDVRVYARQNLVDLASRHQLKASDAALGAARLDERDARDLIVRAVASLYLRAESAAAHADAVQSQVDTAETLARLARDRHDAGTATGVDVLRAEVQLANDQQRLLAARNQYRQTLLALERAIGITPGTPLELAEKLAYAPLSAEEPAALVRSALASRADYLALAQQRHALLEQQRASHARYYPRLSLSGNYGGIGRSVGSMQGTGGIQGQVDFTLFDRDRKGQAQEVAARIRALDARIGDLRLGIEQDVREALLNLDSAAQQVQVAVKGEQLARRELQMAQDRFKHGTANNVEVVTAQDELDRAQQNYILAVSTHVDAKFALARALGNTQQNIEKFAARP